LSVVYVHCTHKEGYYNLPSFGHFGVDIFFVISGFIIAYMVSENTKSFFIKRIIRIVPLYFLITVAITLTAMEPLNLINRTISISDFIKSILFIPLESGNNGDPIIGQGWSMLILALIIIELNLLNPENYIIAYYKNTISLEFIFDTFSYS